MTIQIEDISLKNDNILRGYTTEERPYEIKDYPWGYKLRTSQFCWIETKKGKGDRFCYYTIDPRNGRKCATKYSTYSTYLYMYINEKGHVVTGGIDSYHVDEFLMRFNFIIERVGVEFVSEDQKLNIRADHFNYLVANAPYIVVKYSAEKQPLYKEWLKKSLTHVSTCDFKELVNYPEPPEQDNPDGQIQMVVRERPPAPEPPTHSINAEKVETLLKNALPGFYVAVSEWKGLTDVYLKIVAAVSDKNIHGVEGQKVQKVSLSLNLRTLELQPQMYGGTGGQWIDRKPNMEDAKEKFLAMKSVKIPFRTPACNEKDVLNAITRFAENYKKALIENRAVLMYQDLVNYDELLNAKK